MRKEEGSANITPGVNVVSTRVVNSCSSTIWSSVMEMNTEACFDALFNVRVTGSSAKKSLLAVSVRNEIRTSNVDLQLHDE